MRYFIHDGKTQRGPFTLEALREAALKADYHVWRDGMTAWVKASELEELSHLFTSEPPPFPSEEDKLMPPPLPETAAESAFAEQSRLESDSMDEEHSSAESPEREPDKVKFPLTSRTKIALAAGIFIVFASMVFFILWKKNQQTHQELSSSRQEVAKVQEEKEVAEEQQAAAQEQLIQAQQEEQQQRTAELATEKKKRDLRNNWESYISADIDIKTPLPLGGFSDIRVAVNNRTEFALDLVTVEVTYLTANNYVFKTETVSIDNITAGGIGYGYAPDSQRGSYLRTHISKITARGFMFCYDDFAVTGHSDDPYRCAE